MTAQGRLRRLARSGRTRIRSLQSNERGSAAAELTLCTPLLILLLLFVVFFILAHSHCIPITSDVTIYPLAAARSYPRFYSSSNALL